MPTTRKQKKARKSRGLEILSYIENLDIILGKDCLREMKVQIVTQSEGRNLPLVTSLEKMKKPCTRIMQK